MKENELLALYQKYNDDEIIDLLINGIYGYNVITTSEKYAKRILEQNGIKFYYVHEPFKRSIKRLALCAKMRGIDVASLTYSVDVKTDDIIERIRENEAKELEMYSHDEIKERNLLYDQIVKRYESLINEGKLIK